MKWGNHPLRHGLKLCARLEWRHFELVPSWRERFPQTEAKFVTQKQVEEISRQCFIDDNNHWDPTTENVDYVFVSRENWNLYIQRNLYYWKAFFKLFPIMIIKIKTVLFHKSPECPFKELLDVHNKFLKGLIQFEKQFYNLFWLMH